MSRILNRFLGTTKNEPMLPQAAGVVRNFAGCTLEESADLLGLPLRSTQRLWAYVKAWLLEALAN